MSTIDKHETSIRYGNRDGDALSLEPVSEGFSWSADPKDRRLKYAYVRMQGHDQLTICSEDAQDLGVDDRPVVHVAVGLNRAQIFELWQKLGYLLTYGVAQAR